MTTPTEAQPEAADGALWLAMKFHDTYERLAPSFGYETRKDTRAFDPATPNGKLMVAVCSELLNRVPKPEAAGELLPCPFCGGEAERFGPMGDHEPMNAGGYVIQCRKCSCSSAVMFPCGDDPIPLLIEAWNKRATPPAAIVPTVCPYCQNQPPAARVEALVQGVNEVSMSLMAAVLQSENPNYEGLQFNVAKLEEWADRLRALADEATK